MNGYELYVMVQPIAESTTETMFCVSVHKAPPSVEMTAGYYPLSEDKARGTPGFSHVFNWNYQAADLKLSDLQVAVTERSMRRAFNMRRDFGVYLYRQLFEGKAEEMLVSCFALARADGSQVKLRLMVDSPALNTMPWEYMYYPIENKFLALMPEICLTRYRPSRVAWRRQLISLPLRVLLVYSCPDQQEVDNALTGFQTNLSQNGNSLEFEVIHYTTQDDLVQRLVTGQFQVVHFFATVEASGDESYLVLHAGERSWTVCSVSLLSRMLIGSNVRLVVLTSCQSQSQSWAANLLGARVPQLGVPAVITTQLQSREKWSAHLGRVFYSALAKGESVEQALADTQRRLSQQNDIVTNDMVGVYALFLCTEDGQLFELSNKEEGQDIGARTALEEHQSIINVIQQVGSVVGGSLIGTNVEKIFDNSAGEIDYAKGSDK